MIGNITYRLGMARCLTANCEVLPIAVLCAANKRNAELLARALFALINFASVQGVSSCPSVPLSDRPAINLCVPLTICNECKKFALALQTFHCFRVFRGRSSAACPLTRLERPSQDIPWLASYPKVYRARRAIIYHITISVSSVAPQLFLQLTIIEVCSIKMGQLSLLKSELEVVVFCCWGFFFFFI